ncbi:unnamed protein product, partial [Coregonus sp. 'balchen']
METRSTARRSRSSNIHNFKSGLTLWLVLWLVAVKPSGAGACPRLCVCYPSPMTVSCQSQNFTTVPSGVPYDSQRVFLQNNRITELRADTFGFETQVLWLYSNNITLIEAGAFSNLRNVFRGLVNLDRLLLHDNRIRQVNRRAFRDLGRLTILYLFNNSLAELPGQAMKDAVAVQFLRLNGNPWSCGCEARPLWEWFRTARISSSELMCSSPSPRRGQDLRFLREMDFALCPLPDPGSLAGTTTTTFSTKTRWWFSKHKPAASSKGIFQKSSETVKAFPFSSVKPSQPSSSSTSFSSKYELAEEEVNLPKVDQEEYWANYGNEDASVRCFELECPPGYDTTVLLPSSSSFSFSPTLSFLPLLSLSVLTLSLHLLFG